MHLFRRISYCFTALSMPFIDIKLIDHPLTHDFKVQFTDSNHGRDLVVTDSNQGRDLVVTGQRRISRAIDPRIVVFGGILLHSLLFGEFLLDISKCPHPLYVPAEPMLLDKVTPGLIVQIVQIVQFVQIERAIGRWPSAGVIWSS